MDVEKTVNKDKDPCPEGKADCKLTHIQSWPIDVVYDYWVNNPLISPHSKAEMWHEDINLARAQELKRIIKIIRQQPRINDEVFIDGEHLINLIKKETN